MIQSLPLLRQKLFTAVLSDCLDAAGYRIQAMNARIRPLDESLVLCGRARTALYMDVYDAPEGENPYELEIQLVDDLKPDEVPVFACGASGRIAPWGELLSTAARVRGAAGTVMDGLTRDIRAVGSDHRSSGRHHVSQLSLQSVVETSDKNESRCGLAPIP